MGAVARTSVRDAGKLDLRVGAYLTDGKMLVEVRAVKRGGVRGEDASTPVEDPVPVFLTAEELAAGKWKNVQRSEAADG